jgi:DNA-binding MarR family transcriptional regulator
VPNDLRERERERERERAASESLALASELRPVLLRLNRQLRKEAHPLGVTAGQVTVLNAIRTEPGIGVRGLAEGEGVSPASISVHVSRLTKAGLVERSQGLDRRRVGLTITDAGERVLRSVRSRRTAWLAARLRTLEAAELESVAAALDPLAKLIDEDD